MMSDKPLKNVEDMDVEIMLYDDERKEDLLALMKSKGWKILERFLNTRIGLKYIVLRGCDTLEKLHRAQGEIDALEECLISPKSIYDQLVYDEEEANEKESNDG